VFHTIFDVPGLFCSLLAWHWEFSVLSAICSSHLSSARSKRRIRPTCCPAGAA
jgi:hypothetical protein